MRHIVPVLAVTVFLAALILDTSALLRLAAIGMRSLLHAHPWWVAALLAGAGAAWLWPRRPWRPRRRRGRTPRGTGRGRQRAKAGSAPKPPRLAAPAAPEPAAAPRTRKPRAPRRPTGEGAVPRQAKGPFRT